MKNSHLLDGLLDIMNKRAGITSYDGKVRDAFLRMYIRVLIIHEKRQLQKERKKGLPIHKAAQSRVIAYRSPVLQFQDKVVDVGRMLVILSVATNVHWSHP